MTTDSLAPTCNPDGLGSGPEIPHEGALTTEKLPHPPMRRPLTIAVTLALVTILLLGGVSPLSSGAAARAPSPTPGINISTRSSVDAATERLALSSPTFDPHPDAMHLATPSAFDGEGSPIPGLSAGCTFTGDGEATCGGTPIGPGGQPGTPESKAVGRPSVPVTAPHWYGVETNLSLRSGGQVPSVQFSGRLAYDPLLSEIVLFDGCSYTVCPDNETWTYNGTSWTNVTGTSGVGPSAREGVGLDYDPSFGGVVLFGGTNPQGVDLNDTWLFTSSGWINITSSVGHPRTVGGAAVAWSWGAMAFDPALDSMVVVDGCAIGGDLYCGSQWDYTWFLNVSGWGVSWGPGALTNSTHLTYSAAAYDANTDDLVVYGGYDSGIATSSNYTYLLDRLGGWVNITQFDAGCGSSRCYTPPGRVSEAMTWDGQLDALFMTDGFNMTTQKALNDSWIFSGERWFPANLTAPPAPSGYCPAAQPGMPESSNNIAPIILGGFGPCSPNSSTSEWVYEVPPQLNTTASPLVLDLGMATNFTATWTGGTGTGVVVGWNVSFGDGRYLAPTRALIGANSSMAYSQIFSYTYQAAGTLDPNVTWMDFYYISATSSTPPVTVAPALAATIDASATAIRAGGSITFMTAPFGGNVPYNIAWSFGDGTTSTVQDPPAHDYPMVGFYTVQLTVTDRVNQMVQSTVIITVHPRASGIAFGSVDFYLILGIVAVVVGTLVALLIMRRKGGQKPAPTPRPSPFSRPASAPKGKPPPIGAASDTPGRRRSLQRPPRQ
jgi:PKD domain-containing protein